MFCKHTQSGWVSLFSKIFASCFCPLLCHHFHIPTTAEQFTKECLRFIYFLLSAWLMLQILNKPLKCRGKTRLGMLKWWKLLQKLISKGCENWSAVIGDARVERVTRVTSPWEGGQTLDPWQCPRPGWMGFGAPWDGGSVLAMAGDWNVMIF